MEGPFVSPEQAKRPLETNANGNGVPPKRRKHPPPPLTLSPGESPLRILCHVTTIGGVIGKSGYVIRLLREETGAKIRVEEPITGCEERVILIIAQNSPAKKITLKGIINSEESGEEEAVEVEVSAVQETLLRIFERALEVDAETNGVLLTANGDVSCRLLAERSQIGGVMGKAGVIIKKIRKESGARIRVLPEEELPSCACPADQVIQIIGKVLSVKKALLAISSCLQEKSPSDNPQIAGSRPLRAASQINFPGSRREVPYHNSYLPPPTLGSYDDYLPRGHPVPTEFESFTKRPQKEVTFKLLCTNDKIGGVIGKGGTIVRALQNETGATISVGPSVDESDERVITVSAKENSELQYSPAQNALLSVFARSVEAGIEKGLESGSAAARLLVPSSQIGCLMGKGGMIVKEMRRTTGAGFHIIGGDQIPKCALESEQVVQITGEFENIQDALFHVTGRLRHELLPVKLVSGSGNPNFSSHKIPEISPYGRVREPTSSVLYHDRLTHSGMDHHSHSHSLDHSPSPRLWETQALGERDSRGHADVGRGLISLKGGLGLVSGSKSAIVTNTTVEIVVPESVLGSIYGENGSNLSRLRQISGAKVTIHDPLPGSSETVIIISGSPDQTQAAQSLLQAFILSGQSSPGRRSPIL
ncbi:hypothetical protein GIB67_008167 [Kingdonia uniflora]|uniref:K Homology domain-containing protein n=1 Tax=Kingdonia uniflora TaxID=39325 RepID=A0A7J7LUF5_9MAGN|nr:hypothetical protein GIB67_008167 [Kingdonia uniflora]